MNHWKILSILPTTDKTAIKQAYIENLSLFHPEDDSKGFQRLRQAYETAIKEADNSPLSIWIQKVEQVYNKFSLRISTESWQALLQDDICFQIDSRKNSGYRLLEFLMNNCNLPQHIWKLLDEHFNWQENKKELYGRFQPKFVDFIMTAINCTDNINYNLFESDDDRDYDAWFTLYSKLEQALDEKEIDRFEELLKQMNTLDIKHPDMKILEIGYMLQINNNEQAKKLGKELLNESPDKVAYIYNMGQIELTTNPDEALKYYNRVLEINPNHSGAIEGIAECCFLKGQYEEALVYYEKAYSEGDNYILDCIDTTKEKLTIQYENQLQEQPENNELKLKLSQFYYDLDQYDMCKQILNSIDTIILLNALFKINPEALKKIFKTSTDDILEKVIHEIICLQYGYNLCSDRATNKNLLDIDFDIEQIAKALELSTQQLEWIQKELRI